MALRLVGALGSFNQGTTQWSSYAERMEEYLLANGVTEERKKVAILLINISSHIHNLQKFRTKTNHNSRMVSTASKTAKSRGVGYYLYGSTMSISQRLQLWCIF